MIGKMLYFLFFLILSYLVCQTLYTWFYFNQSKNLIKKVFVGTSLVGEKTKPVFKISLYGDSVGAGVGATSFETSLVGRIAKNFAAKFFVELNNYSVVGNKMADILRDNNSSDKLDLIVLVVGSNNLFRLTPLDKFETDTKKVLKKFSPHAKKLILIGPGRIIDSPAVPIFFRPVYFFQGSKYARILENEAKQFTNVAYVNPLDPPPEAIKIRPNTFAADNFHPNDFGHEFWFDMVKSAF